MSNYRNKPLPHTYGSDADLAEAAALLDHPMFKSMVRKVANAGLKPTPDIKWFSLQIPVVKLCQSR